MTVSGGYQPHILRINLDQETIERELLPDETVLRKYVGGAGLGLHYLLSDGPQGVTATDPEAPLMFMLGPLTGTPAVNSSEGTTICYNLPIPYAAGFGHAHFAVGCVPEACQTRRHHLHGQVHETHVPVDRRRQS